MLDTGGRAEIQIWVGKSKHDHCWFHPTDLLSEVQYVQYVPHLYCTSRNKSVGCNQQWSCFDFPTHICTYIHGYAVLSALGFSAPVYIKCKGQQWRILAGLLFAPSDNRLQHRDYPTLFEKCMGSLNSPDRESRNVLDQWLLKLNTPVHRWESGRDDKY